MNIPNTPNPIMSDGYPGVPPVPGPTQEAIPTQAELTAVLRYLDYFRTFNSCIPGTFSVDAVTQWTVYYDYLMHLATAPVFTAQLGAFQQSLTSLENKYAVLQNETDRIKSAAQTIANREVYQFNNVYYGHHASNPLRMPYNDNLELPPHEVYGEVNLLNLSDTQLDANLAHYGLFTDGSITDRRNRLLSRFLNKPMDCFV